MKPEPIRRRLVLGITAALVALPSAAGRLLPTPRQTAGPFYPVELPLDHDNDLTRVRGRPGLARGGLPTSVDGSSTSPVGRCGACGLRSGSATPTAAIIIRTIPAG